MVEGLLSIKFDKVFRGAAKLCQLVQTQAIRGVFIAVLEDLYQVLSIRVCANKLVKLCRESMPLQRLVNEYICVLRELVQVYVKDGQGCSFLFLSHQFSFLLDGEQVFNQVCIIFECALFSRCVRITQQPNQSVLQRQYLAFQPFLLFLSLLD